MERRILVKLLYEKRKELLKEGRYTDAIDELILKIINNTGGAHHKKWRAPHSVYSCKIFLIISSTHSLLSSV